MYKAIVIQICWADQDNLRLVFEDYARACDALERVKYLQSLGIETKKTREGKTFIVREVFT